MAQAVRDVAWGLQHAHERGVVHRDIKPSNLLCDRQGKSWIADFGLASFPSATTLTRTGELVGTLRYMSPEQVSSGRASFDERSDIYSLGATFFELLTGRPLIDAEQHAEQLRLITTGKFKSPRAMAPDLPVALETIVLHMIAREPADRYPTAGDVARDLTRWLDNQPITARRLVWHQHLTRWSRARTGVLLAIATALLLTVLGLSMLVGELLRSRSNLTAQLTISHIAEAQARVTSRLPGQRFEALNNISQATRARSTTSMPMEQLQYVKQVAATALSLCDARLVRSISRQPGGSLDSVVFSRDLSLCTQAGDSELQILNSDTGQVLTRLPMVNDPLTVCFSKDGHLLFALCGPEDTPTLNAWEWSSQKRLWSHTSDWFPARPMRFAVDVATTQPLLAVGLHDGCAVILDQLSGEISQRIAVNDAAAGQVAFSPNGNWLAISYPALQTVRIWDLISNQQLVERHFSEDTFCCGWTSDSQRLAVGSGFDIFLLETVDWNAEPLSILSGTNEIIANLYFDPSGRWLAAYGYDGKSRLWDCAKRSVVLVLDGHAQYFSTSGDRLAFRSYDRLGLWEVKLDDVVWHQADHRTRELDVDTVSFLCDDRWLAVAGPHGCDIWEVELRRQILQLRGTNFSDIISVSGQESMLVACQQGLFIVAYQELERVSGRGSDEIEFPSPSIAARRLPLPDNEIPKLVASSQDGAVIGVTTASGGVGVILAETQWEWLAKPGASFLYLAVSSDGRFLASAEKNNPQTVLWQLAPSQNHWDLSTGEGGCVAFTEADNQTILVAGRHMHYHCWRLEVGTRPIDLFSIARPSGYQKSVVATAHDFALAVAPDRNTTRLVDPRDGTPYITLVDGYQSDRTIQLGFDAQHRHLAVALGPQGFAVWDLQRLQTELQQVGLPFIP